MGQKFPCPECDIQFTYKANLGTHQKYVHMGQKHQCPDCDYQATRQDSLIKHKKAVDN